MSGEPAAALAGQAHLYLAAPRDWIGGGRLAATLALLSADERRRYERFRVAAPARAFATGRALAREVLSRYAATAPADWRLEPDEHGRPRITGQRQRPALDFNLSHDDRLVACLVTAGAACGVDLESLDRRVDPLRIAEHSFGEDESEDLRRRSGDARRERFFAYWTLKEAYLKARGRGIAMRLDSALFALAPRDETVEIRVRFAPRVGDRAGDWQFALHRAGTRHLLATALRRGAAEDLETRAFTARPDEPPRPTVLELLATSRPAVGAGR